MAEEAPSWLNESRPNNQSIQQPNNQPQSSSPGESNWKTSFRVALFIFNTGFMVMMAACGGIGVSLSNNVSDAGVIFVGIYMILFAAILFIYEIAQLSPTNIMCSSIDIIIKKNFGFLYGPIGKCCYLLFMGILAFGLSTPRQFALATGVLVSLWSIIQGLLYLKFPDYFDKKEKYVP